MARRREKLNLFWQIPVQNAYSHIVLDDLPISYTLVSVVHGKVVFFSIVSDSMRYYLYWDSHIGVRVT